MAWASRDERVCEDCDNGEDEDVDHFNYIAVCTCSRIERNRVMKGMVEREKEMKDDERAWLARVLNRACRNGSVRRILYIR